MRNYVTAAATALTLGFFALATPAMADQLQLRGDGPFQPGQYQGYGNGDQGHGNRGAYDNRNDGWRNDGGRNDGGRNDDRDQDWNRQEGNFDRWEHGWGRAGWDNDRHGNALPYWRLVRRVEQQGYYGVRGLRPSHGGWGYRAFAFNYRGHPVMLRINPYNGRVLDVRYV